MQPTTLVHAPPFPPAPQSGWGPFEVIDMCAALGIEPIITLAYDLNSIVDWGDLVEYCWGDATTTWGAQRIADGHPGVYNITVFGEGSIGQVRSCPGALI